MSVYSGCIFYKINGFVGVFTIGRQFPDKAIDLIDEACSATIKRLIQTDNQAEGLNAKHSRSANPVKGATVVPNDVAQVSIFSQ